MHGTLDIYIIPIEICYAWDLGLLWSPTKGSLPCVIWGHFKGWWIIERDFLVQTWIGEKKISFIFFYFLTRIWITLNTIPYYSLQLLFLRYISSSKVLHGSSFHSNIYHKMMHNLKDFHFIGQKNFYSPCSMTDCLFWRETLQYIMYFTLKNLDLSFQKGDRFFPPICCVTKPFSRGLQLEFFLYFSHYHGWKRKVKFFLNCMFGVPTAKEYRNFI